MAYQGRECRAQGRFFSFPVGTICMVGKGDPHIYVKARRAVANKVPPIKIVPKQPLCWSRVRSRSYLRHVFILAQLTWNQRTLMPR